MLTTLSIKEFFFMRLFSLFLFCVCYFTSVECLKNQVIPRNENTGLCSSIEIWDLDDNSISKLQNCDIVEGYVRLVFVNYANPNITFPHLKEITGYLFLYRSTGLKSVKDLFPNLAVIRGVHLFQSYSVILFENFDLENVGLTSLTRIVRGGVFIAKNPKMCFIETIDWSLITDGRWNKYFANNRLSSECPACDEKCSVEGKNRRFCWNVSSCQLVCPIGCNACSADGTQCCNNACLGGCKNGRPDLCISCSSLLANDVCTDSCDGIFTVEYQNWRCIKKSECQVRFFDSWKLFEDKCVSECPEGYQEREIDIDGQTRLECVKCPGRECRKECTIKSTIKSADDAEKLKGCVVIKGALIIQVSGNIKGQLEESLSSIEEITHYLKITESFQLTSLNFLRKLKRIHGLKREQSLYSLVVMENKNLELLWDWDHKNSTLHINGSIFFHLNPKLCKEQIDRLIKETGVTDMANSFISELTHGVKTVCNVTELQVVRQVVSSRSATIVWKQFEFYDLRRLLGYVIYYKEAQHRNVTIYDGRYVCGGGDWHRLDNISYTEPRVYNFSLASNFTRPQPSNHSIVVSRLKPYTQYAYFVKTLTVGADREAQSPIHYFETLPDAPSAPQYLKAVSEFPNQISLAWKPPLHPHGIVTHYEIKVYMLRDIEDMELDMCHDENKEKYNSTYDSNSFSWAAVDRESGAEFYTTYMRQQDEWRSLIDEGEGRARDMAFEDRLQDRIYVKRHQANVSNPVRRRRRSVIASLALAHHSEEVATHIIRDGTKFVIPNLTHFTRYLIEVKACRTWQPGEDRTSGQNCSMESADATLRTLPSEDADSLEGYYPEVVVSNKTWGSIAVKWEEPNAVNGFIKYYVVEMKRLGPDGTIPVCVSRREYLMGGRSFTVRHLAPGNYSLRIWADSLRGAGASSQIVTFVIPDESYLAAYIYWIIGAIICIAPFVAASMIWYLRRADRKRLDKMIISMNPEYVPSHSYVVDSWEIPRSNVELLDEIGQGSFGKVYEGTLLDGENIMRCAIKTMNANASEREKSEFLNEACVMKAFTPYHVVRLLGVVSKGDPVYVVMELMTRGDLKSYLRSRRPDAADPTIRPPSLRRLLQMAAEIADGMSYLSAKKYVHRDLAARNCMVAEDLTVKIGDFGMARDIYEGDYYRKGTKGLMPVRWMAPESIRDGIFLTLSDVWSYGVVLYEMVTLAAQPYQGLTNDQVVQYILDGETIERPENCPEKLDNLMRRCWQQDPSRRPTFLSLVSLLHQDTSHSFREVSFYDSDEGRQLRMSGHADNNAASLNHSNVGTSLLQDFL